MPSQKACDTKVTKPLAQPWRKNWPPVTNKKDGEMFGTEAGEKLYVDGGAGVANILSTMEK